MSNNNSISKKQQAPNVIEPNKCIIEDLEILAFENEEQLNYYTVWHEALIDKRREFYAESERERQIIRNEIARKTHQLIGTVENDNLEKSHPISKSRNHKTTKISSRHTSNIKILPNHLIKQSPLTSGGTSKTVNSFRTPISHQSPVASSSSRNYNGPVPFSLPSGYTILNSSYFNTMPAGKQIMKYKLTKLYNKYRGRQLRRNFVNEKQRSARIEVEISKSYLNLWLAYTALQALRVPDSNPNSLNTTTNNYNKILTPMAQPTSSPSSTSKKSKGPSKKQLQKQQQQQMNTTQQNQSSHKPPMHLVYIDPGNIITYSNKINPQQVAEYRQKSHLLPSSATSKKSSAASYDVYEIMEVLANTNKTNVTITRNANRPNQSGSSSASIYSHSVNANTPGIVSTQLHLQARSYLDSMGKFYAEEFQRLNEEKEGMQKELSKEEIISKYLKVDQNHSTDSELNQESLNFSQHPVIDTNNHETNNQAVVQDDEELEKLEEEILSMLERKHEANPANNSNLSVV